MTFKKILTHLIPFLVFLVLTVIYFSPVIQGKVLRQTDVIEWAGTAHEIDTYKEATGESLHWTNSTFGGMPIFTTSDYNVFYWVHKALTSFIPTPVLLILLGYIGFYILLSCFKVKPWTAFLGASAYALSTFSLISIEAGHINKVYDMMLMAPSLAGVILVFQRKYLKGALVTTFFLGMQFYYAHVQISYYLMLMMLVLAILELVQAIREKKEKQFAISCVILVASASIALGSNLVKVWSTGEYAKSSTRGGSELSSKKSSGDGLEKDYAFAWSLGKLETMTLFIPYFNGGGSAENIGDKSETFKKLIESRVPRQQALNIVENAPLYWGEQPFTVGPVYLGAIMIFLFVLGLIIVKGKYKWWALTLTILSIMLAWGSNFEAFNDFFFYYVPMYNKFRSVTMILTIAQITVPFLGIYALIQILNKTIDKKEAEKGVLIAFGICGGLALLMFLFGGSIFSFESSKDARLLQQGYPQWLVESIIKDRKAFFKSDALRSLFFVFVAAGLIWAWIKEKIKETYMIAGLALMTLVDLWQVDKRYLSGKDFQPKRELSTTHFSATEADKEILKDTSYYRVFNLTMNPFNEGRTSYHHKSIGGYSAIKLQRYQELIENHISKNNMSVLNMLNTKYFIVPSQDGRPIVQKNPDAVGNVWFIKDLKIVDNADQELSSLQSFNPSQTAFMDKRFESFMPQQGDISFTQKGNIKLQSYNPDHMVYYSESPQQQFAVFSEIYYQPGWQAYIDEVPVEHVRVDYVLRGLIIPEGKHKIEFKFQPNSYKYGEIIGIICSLLVLALVIFTAYKEFAVKKNENPKS
ncbi:YfhO family protein [Aureibacter tunicatorum]|uniref:Membrane protein YfhO n=1 Tax=Aureibacter tunicatorum TaxID=866807 RepID=A0AAE4BTK1_9BACT|nr:YfhO family protein [Aureibacter tunicatorum]MDR6239893.1 hypothetical protein [Aureibacter tunicatorum]BDD04368.1 membrane protein [Aureibacter tunicatorum]